MEGICINPKEKMHLHEGEIKNNSSSHVYLVRKHGELGLTVPIEKVRKPLSIRTDGYNVIMEDVESEKE